jgi:hypothetical protein
MKRRAGIFVAFLAAFAFVVPASAQTRFSGAVKDSEGAVISGARIFIHWDSSGSKVGLTSNVGINEDRSFLTDGNGSFSVELPPGFYDIFVSAMAFSPDCNLSRSGVSRPCHK